MIEKEDERLSKIIEMIDIENNFTKQKRGQELKIIMKGQRNDNEENIWDKKLRSYRRGY